jgi:phosphoenolpyruvate phosphomutase
VNDILQLKSVSLLGNRSQRARGKLGAGVFDGLSATLASKFPFDFLWLSGFSVAASMGLPDLSIVEACVMLDRLRAVERVTELPIVVDFDAGYGDSVRIQYLVREFVQAGASAICIEDNPTSKQCSLYECNNRTLVSIEEHVARLRAAADAMAATTNKCVLLARTEALVARYGVSDALERARAYRAAGAQAIFVQSVDSTGADVLDFAHQWCCGTPLFVAPTRYANVPNAKLVSAGVTHVIGANQAIRAAHRAILDTYNTVAFGTSIGAADHKISSVSEISTDVLRTTGSSPDDSLMAAPARSCVQK